MDRDYLNEYMEIVGKVELENYRSAEEAAGKIEKCTILKNVDVSYSNGIIGYNSEADQCMFA